MSVVNTEYFIDHVDIKYSKVKYKVLTQPSNWSSVESFLWICTNFIFLSVAHLLSLFRQVLWKVSHFPCTPLNYLHSCQHYCHRSAKNVLKHAIHVAKMSHMLYIPCAINRERWDKQTISNKGLKSPQGGIH